jgi:hypothetical protein
MCDLVSPQKHVPKLLRVIWLVGRAFKEYGDGIGRLLLVILLELIMTQSFKIQLTGVVIILSKKAAWLRAYSALCAFHSNLYLLL